MSLKELQKNFKSRHTLHFKHRIEKCVLFPYTKKGINEYLDYGKMKVENEFIVYSKNQLIEKIEKQSGYLKQLFASKRIHYKPEMNKIRKLNEALEWRKKNSKKYITIRNEKELANLLKSLK